MAVDAIPLTHLDGSGGKLRDDWLRHVTGEGVAPRTGGTRKLVYAIAYHASSKTFEVFPSVDTLGDRVALGPNTVRAAFRWFIENGWLILTKQGGGRSLTNRYVLSVPTSWFEEGT